MRSKISTALELVGCVILGYLAFSWATWIGLLLVAVLCIVVGYLIDAPASRRGDE